MEAANLQHKIESTKKQKRWPVDTTGILEIEKEYTGLMKSSKAYWFSFVG